MTDPNRRRYRLVAWPVPHPPNWELCVPAGAVELGVPVLPDDDLVLLYPPEADRAHLAAFAWSLWSQGHAVVLGEDLEPAVGDAP